MFRFRSRIAFGLIAASLLMACFHGLVPLLAAPPATQASGQIQGAIDGMHNAFAAFGSMLGGLSPEQQAKADALEKSTAAKLQANPALLEDRNLFRTGVMADFRSILTPEQLPKFDAAMAAGEQRVVAVRTASHLKQVGVAMVLYANENNGALPPDLGSLLEEELEPGAMLTADSKTTVPENFAKQTPKQKADWVNQNTDFVYLAAGKKRDDLPNDAVVVYTKPATPPARSNFLRNDGSVLSFDAERSAKIVEELKAGKNPPPSLRVQDQ